MILSLPFSQIILLGGLPDLITGNTLGFLAQNASQVFWLFLSF